MAQVLAIPPFPMHTPSSEIALDAEMAGKLPVRGELDYQNALTRLNNAISLAREKRKGIQEIAFRVLSKKPAVCYGDREFSQNI